MQAACSTGFGDNLRHIAMLAAALSGLSLCGCTEKPGDHVALKDNLPAAAPVAARSPAATVTHLPPPAVRPRPQRAAKKGSGFDPALLVGLESAAVDGMLGRPAGTRTEATTVEWIYSGPGCSLRIFFYPDVVTGKLRALQYNITNRRGGEGRFCISFPLLARSDEPD